MTDTTERPSLRDILQVLFRHLRLVVFCTAVCGGGVAALVYLLPRGYTATGTVIIERGKNPTLRTEVSAYPLDTAEMMETEMRLITARSVLAEVVDRENLDAPPGRRSTIGRAVAGIKTTLQGWGLLNRPTAHDRAVRSLQKTLKIEQPALTTVLNLRYSNEDPVRAAEILRRVMEVYLDRRAEIYADDTVAFFRDRVERIETALTELDRRASSANIAGTDSQLELEREALKDSYLFNRGKLDNAEAEVAAGKSLTNVRVVDWPVPPSKPGMSRLLLIIVGTIAGGTLGLGLALVLAYFDHRVHAPADLSAIDIPVLLAIPQHRRLRLMLLERLDRDRPDAPNAHSAGAEATGAPATIRTAATISPVEPPPETLP